MRNLIYTLPAAALLASMTLAQSPAKSAVDDRTRAKRVVATSGAVSEEGALAIGRWFWRGGRFVSRDSYQRQIHLGAGDNVAGSKERKGE